MSRRKLNPRQAAATKSGHLSAKRVIRPTRKLFWVTKLIAGRLILKSIGGLQAANRTARSPCGCYAVRRFGLDSASARRFASFSISRFCSAKVIFLKRRLSLSRVLRMAATASKGLRSVVITCNLPRCSDLQKWIAGLQVNRIITPDTL